VLRPALAMLRRPGFVCFKVKFSSKSKEVVNGKNEG
jgi:hypothetical protein